jgi:hypothetical protein
VKKMKIVKIVSPNGEVHFILKEHTVEDYMNFSSLDEAEVRGTMKKQAAKPLLLLREE